MEKRKIRKFKNHQKRLAKKIAQLHQSKSFIVDYEQRIPSISKDNDTGNLIINNSSQIIFPTKVISKGKHRIIVVMFFSGNVCNPKIIGRILKTQFSIKLLDNGFEVRSSFNPETIGKLK